MERRMHPSTSSLAGGVPGYTYQWSNGSTTEDLFNLTPGNYTVSVTDANGCNGVAGFTVFEATPMSWSWIPSTKYSSAIRWS